MKVSASRLASETTRISHIRWLILVLRNRSIIPSPATVFLVTAVWPTRLPSAVSVEPADTEGLFFRCQWLVATIGQLNLGYRPEAAFQGALALPAIPGAC